MRVLGGTACLFILGLPMLGLPMVNLKAKAAGEGVDQPTQPIQHTPSIDEHQDYPLEIIIRPRPLPRADGYYDNALVETAYGQKLRLSGYHMSGVNRRVINGKVVYDVWQSAANLLTHNILKDAGLLSLPSFEERLAHELVNGSDIGFRLGGVYKNMTLLEVGHSFNFDPTPIPVGFGSKGILGERKITQDFSYDEMIFGIIDFSSVGDN